MLKGLPAEILSVARSRGGRRNLRVLARFFLVLALMIGVYSVGFHLLMEREGQSFSWITGLYWTLTVMSTLGFGDITFHTDAGRLFSILVLLSGMLFLLVLLPFTFIEFFYQPWIQAQADARAPRRVAAELSGHVLLTHYDPVTRALIKRLDQYHVPHVVMVSEMEEALRLHDLGVSVMVGEFDEPEAWQRAGVERAALVACSGDDVGNTNAAFTVRGINERVPIVTTASDEASVDILQLAGSGRVLRLEEMMGQSFARRVIGGDAMAHVMGRFDGIEIAEASAHRTPLVGKTIRESRLRENTGVTVVGVWERGSFAPGHSETRIEDNTVLVLAGSREQMHRYDELFCIYNVAGAPVVILGGGRVGRATARALRARGIDYRIVEKQAGRVVGPEAVIGNAADLEVLRKAGIDESPTVIITPHDDDLNVYLTIYCRRLRPDIQIVARATYDSNVATLHRAGADLVMSYASMGASSIFNLLKRSKLLMVAEGLDLFRANVSPELDGKTVRTSQIREQTGCSVVAIDRGEGMQLAPGPEDAMRTGEELLLIGSLEAEESFLELFGEDA